MPESPPAETAINFEDFDWFKLFKTLKGNKQIQDVVGNALTKFGNKKGIFTEKFANRMAAYINLETGEQVSEFGEEVLTVLSQSIIEGDVKYNENVFTQIGDVVRQALQRVGLIDVKFDTGRDVYNFVKDFNKSIEKNYTSKAITRAAVEGIKGKLLEGDQDVDVDAKTTFSKEEVISFPPYINGSSECFVRVVSDNISPQLLLNSCIDPS